MPCLWCPSTASPIHGQLLPKKQLSTELLPWGCSIPQWHKFGSFPQCFLLSNRRLCVTQPLGTLKHPAESALRGHPHRWAAVLCAGAEALKNQWFLFPEALWKCKDGGVISSRISDGNLVHSSQYFSLLCHPRNLKYQRCSSIQTLSLDRDNVEDGSSPILFHSPTPFCLQPHCKGWGRLHWSLHQAPRGLPSYPGTAFTSNYWLSSQLIAGINVVGRTALLPRDNLIWLNCNQSVNSLRI